MAHSPNCCSWWGTRPALLFLWSWGHLSHLPQLARSGGNFPHPCHYMAYEGGGRYRFSVLVSRGLPPHLCPTNSVYPRRGERPDLSCAAAGEGQENWPQGHENWESWSCLSLSSLWSLRSLWLNGCFRFHLMKPIFQAVWEGILDLRQALIHLGGVAYCLGGLQQGERSQISPYLFIASGSIYLVPSWAIISYILHRTHRHFYPSVTSALNCVLPNTASGLSGVPELHLTWATIVGTFDFLLQNRFYSLHWY